MSQGRMNHAANEREMEDMSENSTSEPENSASAKSVLNAPASRRAVIMGAAAIAGTAGMSGMLPQRLMAAADAAPASFDLSQIKHVVYVMQENRSFDHYFGTFPGVRGFDDPTALTLANGNSVFQQPDPSNPLG